MSSWSPSSKEKLLTAHPDLQELFNAVLQRHDCSVVYGMRAIDEQKKLVADGLSKTMNSKHLRQSDGTSHAVDVTPYPFTDWDDTKKFYYFAGIVMATADELGLDIRWGGDWDSDNDLDDQSFMDLVHFELR